jgi:hypothetical protein
MSKFRVLQIHRVAFNLQRHSMTGRYAKGPSRYGTAGPLLVYLAPPEKWDLLTSPCCNGADNVNECELDSAMDNDGLNLSTLSSCRETRPRYILLSCHPSLTYPIPPPFVNDKKNWQECWSCSKFTARYRPGFWRSEAEARKRRRPPSRTYIPLLGFHGDLILL